MVIMPLDGQLALDSSHWIMLNLTLSLPVVAMNATVLVAVAVAVSWTADGIYSAVNVAHWETAVKIM